VSQQVLTDLTPLAFLPAGASGLFEVTGLVWWATWIVPRLLRVGQPLVPPAAGLAAGAASAPGES
jgi:hypothetical protein